MVLCLGGESTSLQRSCWTSCQPCRASHSTVNRQRALCQAPAMAPRHLVSCCIGSAATYAALCTPGTHPAVYQPPTCTPPPPILTQCSRGHTRQRQRLGQRLRRAPCHSAARCQLLREGDTVGYRGGWPPLRPGTLLLLSLGGFVVKHLRPLGIFGRSLVVIGGHRI